jgi:ankyrin
MYLEYDRFDARTLIMIQKIVLGKPDTIHRADFRLSDICNLLDEDWIKLAAELDVAPSDIALIQEEYPSNNPQQAMIMFRLWLRQKANKATGN